MILNEDTADRALQKLRTRVMTDPKQFEEGEEEEKE